jgi:beta-glucosidase
MELKFPTGFLWGAATSAHQVEGNNINDWTEWEEANADRLARDTGKKWAPWQQEQFPEMFERSNYISGRACDHYNRYEQDFNIAKTLGHNAHRFSIEWSRIEPEEGIFDEVAIEHYRQVLKALRARGLEPFVTIWHWTNPLWIRDIGGWKNKKTIDYFARYAEKITQSFKDINYWITVNEPNIYAGFGYISGNQPPAMRNYAKGLKVFYNLLAAHRQAYTIIHKHNQAAKVGLASSVIYFESKNNFFINKIGGFIASFFWNYYTFRKIRGFNDFIGCNYYARNLIGFGRRKKPEEINDLGWGILPKGIYNVLKKFKRYNLPIYITENGIADARDQKRAAYIREHLSYINKAIQEGVNIRGYLYWSLLDNFEFVDMRGFWPRFGLVEVDYKTLERKIRPSALDYAEICKNNILNL